MKGIILAGGTGSRLFPCTKVTNKHLLPVYNKPMIYYPLFTLINAGIKDIMIVSGREHVGHFTSLLGSGIDFGVNFTYKVQEGAGGIAEALALAENFANKEPIIEILGDNIFEEDFSGYIKDFENQIKDFGGCKIFLKEVGLKAAKRFGIAVVEGNRVIHVEEKPKNPRSNLAMSGICIFDSNIFNIIKTLKRSPRGELEITDAINHYVQSGKCYYNILKGFWSDAGTFESLNRAGNLVREKESTEESHWTDTDDSSEKFSQPNS